MEMHPLIKIVWIILIGIILVSIRRILNEKGWKIGSFIRIEDDVEDNKNENFAGAMSLLASTRNPVDRFFEKVTVNTDETMVRENRLKLLGLIRSSINQIADFSQIEGGER